MTMILILIMPLDLDISLARKLLITFMTKGKVDVHDLPTQKKASTIENCLKRVCGFVFFIIFQKFLNDLSSRGFSCGHLDTRHD
jgi:hypothetical protein